MRVENDPTKNQELKELTEEIDDAIVKLDEDFSSSVKRYQTDPEYARQVDMEADAFPQTQ